MLAATEAMEIGYGGVSLVSQNCGLSRVTITKGIGELSMPALSEDRVRRPGGGRKKLTLRDPELPELLEGFVEPSTRGDPESPLRWTCKSTRTLARELTMSNHPISHEKAAQLLRDMQSRSAIFLPARANETRSSTGFFLLLLPTGEANHC